MTDANAAGVCDLRDRPDLIPDYVRLRNRHVEPLLTEPVDAGGTARWLAAEDVEVRCLLSAGALRGAVVLYPRRGGEVAVFAEESGSGIGRALLGALEQAARERGLAEVWAWVRQDNPRALRLFQAAGFAAERRETRTWRGQCLPGLVLRRRLSAQAHTQATYGLRAEAAEFPLMCVLAVTYVCNARCPSCPYTNSRIRESYRDQPFMAERTFHAVADQCGPHRAWVRISGGGEPLLHPQAVELIEYAKHAGARVGLITNGSRLTEESTRRLLEAGVDMIEFSVDAGDPATYARVRAGLSWEALVANVRRTADLRERLGSPTKLIASGIAQTGVDIEAAAAFWEPLVDSFQRRKYLTWGINDPAHSADPAPYLPPGERVPCPFLFERLNVDSRGTVMVCGFDIAGTTDLGNVNTAGIAQIWHGAGFAHFRRLHLERRGDEIELCRRCPDWQYRSWTHNYWKLVRTAEQRREARAAGLGFHDIEGAPAEGAAPEKP